MDMTSTKLKKNDNVVILTGKDRGKRGKILLIDRKKGRIIVEGINKKKKYVKPSQQNPKGGSISLEYPVQISNVMMFCEKCKKGIKIKFEYKDDKKIRVCNKCEKSFN